MDDDGCEQTFRLVGMVSVQWREFGILLGFSQNELNALNDEHRGNVKNCWDAVMDGWISGVRACDYHNTWDGLCGLLNDLELSAVANDLKKAVARCNTLPPWYETPPPFAHFIFVSNTNITLIRNSSSISSFIFMSNTNNNYHGRQSYTKLLLHFLILYLCPIPISWSAITCFCKPFILITLLEL